MLSDYENNRLEIHIYETICSSFSCHSYYAAVLSAQKILTLEDAMDIAIKNSPEIIKSELNMTISRENLNAQEAATKSLFQFQVSPFSYFQNRSFDKVHSYWVTTEGKGASGDFIVSQPIKFTDGTVTLQNTFTYHDNISDLPDCPLNQGIIAMICF